MLDYLVNIHFICQNIVFIIKLDSI